MTDLGIKLYKIIFEWYFSLIKKWKFDYNPNFDNDNILSYFKI